MEIQRNILEVKKMLNTSTVKNNMVMNPLKMDVLKNTKLCQTVSFLIVTYKRYKTGN